MCVCACVCVCVCVCLCVCVCECVCVHACMCVYHAAGCTPLYRTGKHAAEVRQWRSPGAREQIMAHMDESWHIWMRHSTYERLVAHMDESWRFP